MVFTKIGYGTIAPGGWFRWGVNWASVDKGAQYVLAHPIPESEGMNPHKIMTDEQTKAVSPRTDTIGRTWDYYATFHNLDNERSVNFTMHGGGFI